MWKRKDKSWLEDTALEKMLVRYGKNAFRLFMFPKAETYVFLVGNVSFGFGNIRFRLEKHTIDKHIILLMHLSYGFLRFEERILLLLIYVNA